MPLLLAAFLTQVLQPKLQANETHSYKVTSVEKDFEGSSDKVSRTINQAMPVRITALKAQAGKASVTVVTGPLMVRGRSVGRAKLNDFDIDSTNSAHGDPYALLGVVFHVGGVRPGQSWSAKFRGSPPLTAGLTATYKLTKQTAQAGERVALLTVSVSGDTSCRIRGAGQLTVGAADGIVRSGALHFEIAYLRPGSGKSMVVNSHDGLDYVISPL